MEIEIEDAGAFWKVSLSGRFVSHKAEAFHEEFGTERIESRPFVLFDLGEMTHIDSMGIGVLVSVLMKCRENGGYVALARLQPHPRIVFDITKIYRMFAIRDTVAEAETALADAIKEGNRK